MPGDAAAPIYGHLTPLSLNLASAMPFIEWGDLANVRFSDPFFRQTIKRWMAAQPSPPVVRSDLAALAEFDSAPGRDPCGLIFHMSRCGSTLLSRMLGTMPRTLVISEPEPLNAVLAAARAGADEMALAQIVRCLVRALGCRRFGEQRYVLKTSSWNVRRWRLLHRAFPAAKIVFVQRAPAEVMSSLRADPPGWLQLRCNAPLAKTLLDIQVATGAEPDADEFGAHGLAALLAAATEAADQGALIVDYRELPAAGWTRVAPFLGIDATAHDVALMQDESRYYAKDSGRRLFTGDPPERRPSDSRLCRLTAEIVEPAYRELDRRRRLQLPGGAIEK
jgi:hypothetical protein